jgi:glycosyltransferase involved in cell wall biosynthesis
VRHPRLRIGMDYRPALLLRSGIGRYVTNLAAALAAHSEDVDLALYAVFRRGHREALAAASAPASARLVARRLPARALDLLARALPAGAVGAETFSGPLDIFHHTDYVRVPRRRAASVFTLHDLSFLRSEDWHPPRDRERLEAVTRRLIGESKVIITVSETTRADLQHFFEIPDERIVVAPLGVDPRSFPRRGPRRSDSRPYILAVGTLEPRKNFARLLDAVRLLVGRGSDIRLELVGRPGWLCGEVHRRLADPRLRPHVLWHGEVDEGTLQDLLAGARALAYPSVYEGFGLPVLEGMAMGLPVLTSDRGATREVAGSAAELIDPDSTESIAAGLERLWTNAARRHELATLGPERARDFTWERCAAATIEGYRRAMEFVS